MPEKMKGGGYEDFYTPMNHQPTRGDNKDLPAVANVPVMIPPDPLGVVPSGGKKKGRS